MAVRVKLKFQSIASRFSIEVVALLKSGFETERPQILLPKKVAESLGIRLSKAQLKSYEVAGGEEISLFFLPDAAKVQLANVKSLPKLFSVAISETEKEVILSDAGLSALNIVIEDAKKGIWRIKNENKLRKSYKKQLWY